MKTATEICKLKGLLNKGMDNVKSRIISAAAEGVSSSDLELLIEASGLKNSDLKQNETLSEALVKAFKFDHQHCMRALVEAKADVNIVGEDGVTPLSCAAGRGHVEAIRMLLEAKADVTTTSKHVYTPLGCAAGGGHVEAVRMLLEAKAYVNTAGKDGVTPLLYAAGRGDVEIVRMLLEAKADVNTAGKDGDTPLSHAARFGHVEVVRMLLEAKADVNIVGEHGVTPLSCAAERGYVDLVWKTTRDRNNVLVCIHIRMYIHTIIDKARKEGILLRARRLTYSYIHGCTHLHT
jgi:ankyrin repeat protein